MDAFAGFYVDEKAVRVENIFLEFLKRFKVDDEDEPFYEMEIEAMKTKESNTMFVDFSHVMRYNDLLQKAISEEFLRFEPYLKNACKRFAMEYRSGENRPAFVTDENPSRDIKVSFYNIPLMKRLRDLTTSEIGKLISVMGVVTRTSEVRPELLSGTFKCLECFGVIKDVEQQFKYTEPIICSNATCSNRNRWALIQQESKFADWQRLRMQESSKEIPAGSLPRSLDVILRHEIVEHARAGDTVIFTGSLVVVPDVMALASPGDRAECRRDGPQRQNAAGGHNGVKGLKALGVRDLSYRLAFIASSVQLADGRKESNIRDRRKDDEDDKMEFTQKEEEEITNMRNTPDFLNKIVDSVCPTVFGHQEIKRAVILMLLGGVHKYTYEGINLRGDINVCIVGDPSCAKSQFLKYVTNLVPRSVYTSGKSSSAAGLTATVAKEPETGEFCIEAGALMLADNGVCCIDEFDKMDIKDQVAIHEAMEQQTISITKAGIQATLNARTSILAAANPTGGRYDKSKPLKYNVALPPAILSRFDLVYVMIDEPDDMTDYHIAHHIVRVHQHHEDALSPAFTTAELKRYIGYAKSLKPRLSSEAKKVMVESYVTLRRADATPGSKVSYRMTVRQLEALIRLSEAIARLHLEEVVRPAHVRMAVKLLKTSVISVESSEIDLTDFQEDDDQDPASVQGEAQQEPTDSEVIPGNAVGSRQRKKISTTEENFQRVTRALVMRVRQHEESVLQEGGGLAGMKQRDLIIWYVEKRNTDGAYKSIDEVKTEIECIKAIIESLIHREGHLIVIDDGQNDQVAAAEGGEEEISLSDREKRILAVAPNYMIG